LRKKKKEKKKKKKSRIFSIFSCEKYIKKGNGKAIKEAFEVIQRRCSINKQWFVATKWNVVDNNIVVGVSFDANECVTCCACLFRRGNRSIHRIARCMEHSVGKEWPNCKRIGGISRYSFESFAIARPLGVASGLGRSATKK
jgi:hypothetical protein